MTTELENFPSIAKEQFDDGEKNPYQSKINAIRKSIYLEDKRVREKYSWLKYQNELGLAFFLGSLAGIIITSYFYWVDLLAWYWTMVLVAFFVSILHELEHDIIHELYFKDHPWTHHVAFALIWIAKVGSNPWWRKHFHLKHHRYSGQIQDVEERLIGLGVPLGLKRLLLTLSNLATPLVIFDVARDSRGSPPELDICYGYFLNLPVMLPAHILFASIFFPSYFEPQVYSILWKLNMILFFPNVLRQGALQFISTGCHYYGDIPAKNVFFQNQVLNHWILYPLQAFCFNFGATHIIHHYVTRQPFYLRQMAAFGIYPDMLAQGVRFNDLSIWSRCHRYNRPEDSPKVSAALAS